MINLQHLLDDVKYYKPFASRAGPRGPMHRGTIAITKRNTIPPTRHGGKISVRRRRRYFDVLTGTEMEGDVVGG